MITFDYLKHHQSHITTCAQWSCNEWGHHTPERPLQDFIESRKKYLNVDSLPLTILAFDGNTPIGMCSLTESRGIYPELCPWLAALYVVPEYRNRGIGRQLEERICTIARTMEYANIYCFTSDKNIMPWYKKHGWRVKGTDQLHNHEVIVMQKSLS